MGLMDRLRNGIVGATLRFGVEGGINEATRTRARQNANGTRETVSREAADVEAPDVGLPVGETALEDLLKEGDRDEIFGVSMAEMRYMAGIPDPFGEVKFDPTGMDFGDLEHFRSVRNEPEKLRTEQERKALLEQVERDGVAAPDDRFRVFHFNPRPDEDF